MHAKRMAFDLPSPFRLTTLREAGDAFAFACDHAAELGGGALVRVGRFGGGEFAAVLEPEEPLSRSRCVFYAGMTALVSTLAALLPPQLPVAIAWPDAVRVGGMPVGGGRLGWPEGAAEDAGPDWLVFAAAIAPNACEDGGGDALVEGFARHLMAALDCWREEGFAPIARHYLAHLEPEARSCRRLAANGDLETADGRRSLRAALAAPSWLGPRR
jgi:hypothetical protein